MPAGPAGVALAVEERVRGDRALERVAAKTRCTRPPFQVPSAVVVLSSLKKSSDTGPSGPKPSAPSVLMLTRRVPAGAVPPEMAPVRTLFLSSRWNCGPLRWGGRMVSTDQCPPRCRPISGTSAPEPARPWPEPPPRSATPPSRRAAAPTSSERRTRRERPPISCIQRLPSSAPYQTATYQAQRPVRSGLTSVAATGVGGTT